MFFFASGFSFRRLGSSSTKKKEGKKQGTRVTGFRERKKKKDPTQKEKTKQKKKERKEETEREEKKRKEGTKKRKKEKKEGNQKRKKEKRQNGGT